MATVITPTRPAPRFQDELMIEAEPVSLEDVCLRLNEVCQTLWGLRDHDGGMDVAPMLAVPARELERLHAALVKYAGLDD